MHFCRMRLAGFAVPRFLWRHIGRGQMPEMLNWAVSLTSIFGIFQNEKHLVANAPAMSVQPQLAVLAMLTHCCGGIVQWLCPRKPPKTAPKCRFLRCKLPRLRLQNVPFRILKRPVSHCDMCRFAFRRGFWGIPIWLFCLPVSCFVAFCRVKFRRKFKSFLHFK